MVDTLPGMFAHEDHLIVNVSLPIKRVVVCMGKKTPDLHCSRS